MRFWRVAKAMLGTALTWGVAWIPFGLIPIGLAAMNGGVPVPAILTTVAWQGMIGALSGAVFAGTILAFGRRKTFETLSMPWIAACGAVGGALLPFAVKGSIFAIMGWSLPMVAVATDLVLNGLLGAGFATATLALARRAPRVTAGERLAAIEIR